jgi:membrane-bound inhibitor of C-type lysozyme
VIVECADFASFISATFIQTDLPVVFLRWGDADRLVLTLGPSGSGARYVGTDDKRREVVFWDKGREALLELPGRNQLVCQVKQLS